MGDYFQTAAVPSIAEADTPSRAAIVIAWLVAEEIVCADESKCVLSAHFGHRPGARSGTATGSVDVDLDLVTNGVEISTTRRVFHPGQGDFGLICPACGTEFDSDLDGWGGAVDEWLEGQGPGTLGCPSCAAREPVTKWTFNPVWAFGCLGVTFWNWPTLTDDFLRKLEHCVGAPLVLVRGKL